MTVSYYTYMIAQSLASHKESSLAICTRSMFMELVKHINLIGNILGISWITSELPEKYLWFEC